MDIAVETCCKMNLLREGVPVDSVQSWYDVVYAKPELLEVGKMIAKKIARITDSDIMDLLTVYGEDGSMAALEEAIEYFSKLYGVSRELPIIEINSARIETIACISGFEKRSLELLAIGVKPDTYEKLDGAALLIAAAHEVWHARQVEQLAEWLASLNGAKLNFEAGPSGVRREMLYWLNKRYFVRVNESRAIYGKQIIEGEAYCASSIMTERVRNFSELVLEKARRSMMAVPSILG